MIARSDQGQLPIRRARERRRRALVRRAPLRRPRERRWAPARRRAGGRRLVDADEARLEQALGNMVDNALRYGAGPVTLAARSHDGVVEKPHRVTPRSAASSTARVDGAPTATTTGQPATAAFCTSSNERRPLTQRTWSRRGRRPSRNARPITLSIALCRPTSSRAQTSAPAGVKSPVAWSPPVEANAAWASRSLPGRVATTALPIVSVLSTGGASTAIASSAPLPQTPHDDVV